MRSSDEFFVNNFGSDSLLLDRLFLFKVIKDLGNYGINGICGCLLLCPFLVARKIIGICIALYMSIMVFIVVSPYFVLTRA